MPLSVEVPFGDSASDTATLLLAAAESLNMDQSVVKTGTGVFIVPTEVAEAAESGVDSGVKEEQETVEKQAPKRQSAAKKAAKKK